MAGPSILDEYLMQPQFGQPAPADPVARMLGPQVGAGGPQVFPLPQGESGRAVGLGEAAAGAGASMGSAVLQSLMRRFQRAVEAGDYDAANRTFAETMANLDPNDPAAKRIGQGMRARMEQIISDVAGTPAAMTEFFVPDAEAVEPATDAVTDFLTGLGVMGDDETDATLGGGGFAPAEDESPAGFDLASLTDDAGDDGEAETTDGLPDTPASAALTGRGGAGLTTGTGYAEPTTIGDEEAEMADPQAADDPISSLTALLSQGRPTEADAPQDDEGFRFSPVEQAGLAMAAGVLGSRQGDTFGRAAEGMMTGLNMLNVANARLDRESERRLEQMQAEYDSKVRNAGTLADIQMAQQEMAMKRQRHALAVQAAKRSAARAAGGGDPETSAKMLRYQALVAGGVDPKTAKLLAFGGLDTGDINDLGLGQPGVDGARAALSSLDGG